MFTINSNGLLFTHYYIPSFVLSCLLFGIVIDEMSRYRLFNLGMIIMLISIAITFIYFLPLTLVPETMDISEAISRQWLPGWNFAILNTQ